MLAQIQSYMRDPMTAGVAAALIANMGLKYDMQTSLMIGAGTYAVMPMM